MHSIKIVDWFAAPNPAFPFRYGPAKSPNVSVEFYTSTPKWLLDEELYNLTPKR